MWVGWLLSPDGIKDAAARCEWGRTGADSVYAEIREKQAAKQKEWREKNPDAKPEWQKWPVLPYIDYCATYGQFYLAAETICSGCGARRMYEPPKPPELTDSGFADIEDLLRD